MMKLSLCFVLCGVLAGTVLGSPVARDQTVVDGKSTTVANLITDYLLGLIPNDDVALLIRTIIDAFNEPEFDYWGNVKAEVEGLVGAYINEHNMHQVEIYQKDLQELMQRYSDAPTHSDSYADKNLQASALSTSIITHRYLTEASLMKESMVLHFEDIASIHIAILKDVAETYSVDGSPSRWWVDLDQELDHYIQYAELLRRDLKEWRMSQVSCSVSTSGPSCTNWEWIGKDCFDYYTVTDAVTGETSTCTQLHETTSCESHCQLFQGHKEVEVEVFYDAKVYGVIDAWKQLKEVSSDMAANASKLYDPVIKA